MKENKKRKFFYQEEKNQVNLKWEMVKQKNRSEEVR